MDYERESELILTAASDNKIKIWTTKKILLYDVLLDDGLAYAFFVPHPNIPNHKIQEVKKLAAENDEKYK